MNPGGHDVHPLTAAQVGLLYLHETDPRSAAAYNVPFGSLLKQVLDVEVLREAMAEVARRHPILGSVVVTGDRGYAQRYGAAPVPVRQVEVDDLHTPATQRMVDAAKDEPFDLFTEAPTRLCLFTDGRETVLLLVLHHIASDLAAGMEVVADLLELYAAAKEQREPDLPPIPPSFAEHAEREHAFLTGPRREKAMAYWRETLAGCEFDLDLPEALRTGGDPEGPSFARFLMERELAAKVHAKVKETGTSAAMVLLAAFGVLLRALTGHRDVLIGFNTEGRKPKFRASVGYFAGQLLLRLKPEDHLTFDEMISRTHLAFAGAVRNQDLPAPVILGELGAGGNSGKSLLQVNFQYEPYRLSYGAHSMLGFEQESITLSGFELSGYPVRPQVAAFPLVGHFCDYETEQTFLGGFHFDPQLLDLAAAEGYVARFSAILGELLDRPGATLGEVCAVTPEERARLMAWAAEDELSSTVDVLTAFRQRAAAHPERVALVAAGEQHTYAQLEAASAALAGQLAGIGPGSVVGLCLPRDASMAVAMLAVLRRGATWLALDPAYPDTRLAQLAEDAEPGVVLCTGATRRAALDALPTLNLDELGGVPGLLAMDGRFEPDLAYPEDPAYLIFTSGSTGRPKGVAVSRGAFSAHLHDIAKRFALSEVDRVLVFGSFSFDVSLEQLFAPLVIGGTSVIRPEEVLAAADLFGFLAEQRISVFNPPTGVWRQLALALADGTIGQPAHPPRLTIVGGDAMPAADVAVWQANVGGRLVNAYGPTESVITPSTYDVTGTERPGALPIGRPVGARTAYVLDEALNLVRPGGTGELYLGGTIAQGYWRRPGLTADRFLPDPFGPPGARLYRTGDLVRFDAKGNLEFAGRADNQVKVRGFRIEPGEIEAVLTADERVRAAIVVARPVPGGDVRLVGYVVGAGEDLPESLRAKVAAELPAHLVPAAIVVLDALPLSGNGKVDVKALPEPELATVVTEYTAPGNPVEQRLAEIWAEVLGLEQVGVHDDYLALGGDSILSIQIVARARQYGIWLNPKQLFDHPTIAGLAAHAEVSEGAGSLAGAEIEVSGAPAPMHHWFAELAGRPGWNPGHWNMAVLLELRGQVPEADLRRALNAVLAAHESLRTRFLPYVDTGLQVEVQEQAEVALDVLDGPTVDEATTRRLHETVFPTEGEVFRAAYAPHSGQLLLVAHHLVVDVVSWRIILEDLAEALVVIAEGGEPELAPEGTTFRQWTTLLTRRAHDPSIVDAVQAELEFLPEVPAQDAGLEGEAVGVRRVLDAATTQALREKVLGELGGTLEEALLTAAGRAQAALTGRTEVLLELESHGRADLDPAVDTTRTVGWFTALAPFPLSAAGDPLATLWQVRAQLRETEHRGLDHNVVRYLGQADLRPVRPEINVNYLGLNDDSTPAEAPFTVLDPRHGVVRDPKAPRAVPVLVEGALVGGELVIDVQHTSPGAAEALASSILTELHALSRVDGPLVTGGVHPSLVAAPLVREWAAAKGPLEAVWPLTPMQNTMLFRTLAAGGSGVYVDQLAVTLDGDLDPELAAQAWREVVARNPVLRGSCAWGGLPAPVLVVAQRIELEVAVHDYRGEPDPQAAVAEYVRADHARGFDLANGPLLRVALLRTADRRWQMLFSQHHVILDGWSVPLLLGEMLTVYSGLATGEPVRFPASPDYGRFLRWAHRRDRRNAVEDEKFWAGQLAGFTQPALLWPGVELSGRNELATRDLGQDGADRLRALAAEHGVTTGSLLHAAWALVVGHRAGRADVVIGSVTSGRPAELDGVEEMVGNFINTIPLRVNAGDDTGVAQWLRGTHQRLTEIRDHEHTSTARISANSELPQGVAPFDTAITVANYPTPAGELPGLSVVHVHAYEQADLPAVFSGVVRPEELTLTLNHDPTVLDTRQAGELLDEVAAVLTTAATASTVGELRAELAARSAARRSDRRRARLARATTGRTGREVTVSAHHDNGSALTAERGAR